MSAVASSSATNSERNVRFDDECVLIPQCPFRKPGLLVTKSYILPWWKRKASPHNRGDGTKESNDISLPDDKEHITLRIPLPSFLTKPSRSPHCTHTEPLSPCLVHRERRSASTNSSPTIHHTIPTALTRTASLPMTDHTGKPVATVPLRACCPNCFHTTEQSLQEGDQWKEKFTRGARRLRRASVDYSTSTSVSSASTSSDMDLSLEAAEEALFHPRRHSVSTTEKAYQLKRAAEPDTLSGLISIVSVPTSPPIVEEDEEFQAVTSCSLAHR
ncbi:uncharacterized protein BT62DRAFT_1073660 [Guyanagaster necrorhizus]|uniref:Uncharacterized protein n=1 Tax=Guyanagaster necrorhizus TaxID=856835 RepID=A0A9P8AVB8_9AGAR|nr:uncharacterized protein BT62DRAFT_1073660 [Guyanagaster necrorhizus MCA 3950]KAG7449135.1 hypothetical protein BT62DRAFT_1073660 [Guyanagaster necrorhizus MCA 3950]